MSEVVAFDAGDLPTTPTGKVQKFRLSAKPTSVVAGKS